MGKQNEYTLMKARSAQSVLAAGFRLYNDHFSKFFKASWLMTLLYAAVFSAAGTLAAIQTPALIARLMTTSPSAEQQAAVLTHLALLWGLFMVGAIVETLTYATIVNKLDEHSQTDTIATPASWWRIERRMMMRTLKGALSTAVILFVFGFIWGFVDGILPSQSVVALTVRCIVVGALILLSIPLPYVLMRYLLNGSLSYWPAFRHSYSTGLRHLGLSLTVWLGALLTVFLLGLIAALPAMLLGFTNWEAQNGVLIGDPLGMPSYITHLTASTTFFTGILLVYLRIPLLCVNYYLYGSIEKRERQKAQDTANP
ncbi:MAG: hypothetical protein IJ710_00765 [Prevotella sp.]|nr:hypothetical protein [Prevotella sp.]